MGTNIDLKNIWTQQKIETPKIEILYAKANKLKSRRLLKLIVVNITLLLTAISIGFIWYYYQPELVTTKMGIVCTILAMIIFVLSYNTQFSLLSNTKTEPNSKEYLTQLIQLKEKQTFQQTTMLSIYFLMLSLGIGLYYFEYVSKMTLTWGIVTCVTTALWFAINWFYFRPRAIKKQNTKLNKLLIEFEKLNAQITA